MGVSQLYRYLRRGYGGPAGYRVEGLGLVTITCDLSRKMQGIGASGACTFIWSCGPRVQDGLGGSVPRDFEDLRLALPALQQRKLKGSRTKTVQTLNSN